MAATDEIVHLLRRTEYVARPERVAALTPGTYAAGGRRRAERAGWRHPDPGRTRVPRRGQQLQPVPASRAVVVRTDGQDVDPADPGEDGVLLARTLLQRVGQGVRHRGDDAAEQAVPRPRPRQRAHARSGDGDPAGDAALPRQRRQPQELAEPELRPRAARAVPARRRELHRGRRRGIARRRGPATASNWSNQYVFTASQHDSTVRTFLGQPISNGPDVINVVLGPTAVIAVGPNAGTPARVVAARFLSKKLWEAFAHQAPSATIVNALGDVLVANDFAITPWVRAMLNRAGVPVDDGAPGSRQDAGRVHHRPAVPHRDRGLGRPSRVVRGGHGPGDVLPAQRERLEDQRLLGQRQRGGRPGVVRRQPAVEAADEPRAVGPAHAPRRHVAVGRPRSDDLADVHRHVRRRLRPAAVGGHPQRTDRLVRHREDARGANAGRARRTDCC